MLELYFNSLHTLFMDPKQQTLDYELYFMSPAPVQVLQSLSRWGHYWLTVSLWSDNNWAEIIQVCPAMYSDS